MATTLVKELLEAGVHFGHQTNRWHPKMKPYIFGSRSGIYIIDLEKTEGLLQEACAFLERVAADGQEILFVGTKKQARPIIEETAKRTKMPFVINRWLGGTLTNFQTIKRNIDRLRNMRAQKEEGYVETLSKKEGKQFMRRYGHLEEHYNGLAEMEKVPGCVFIVDTKREHIAVHEASRLGIPIVAICDTNVNPEAIAHPIPGNDDAIRSLRLLLSIAGDRIAQAREQAGLNQPQVEEPQEVEKSPSVPTPALEGAGVEGPEIPEQAPTQSEEEVHGQ